MMPRLLRTMALVAITLLAVLALSALYPAPAHAQRTTRGSHCSPVRPATGQKARATAAPITPNCGMSQAPAARPSVAAETAANSATRTAWAFIRLETPGISGRPRTGGRHEIM